MATIWLVTATYPFGTAVPRFHPNPLGTFGWFGISSTSTDIIVVPNGPNTLPGLYICIGDYCLYVSLVGWTTQYLHCTVDGECIRKAKI